jgi:hypothetical protein
MPSASQAKETQPMKPAPVSSINETRGVRWKSSFCQATAVEPAEPLVTCSGLARVDNEDSAEFAVAAAFFQTNQQLMARAFASRCSRPLPDWLAV